MKKIKLLISIIIVTHCSAQLPQYYVSTITGSATVTRASKILALKKGDFIFKADTIAVKNSSVVTLIDYDNKIIVVNNAGKYTYNDLQKSMNVKSTGITESFLKFVWEDLFKPEPGGTLLSPASIGAATGGASRGGCDLTREPLNGSKISDDTVYFSWQPVSNAKMYRFTLKDSSRNEIINILTKDTSLGIFKRDLMQGDGTPYFWSITQDANSNNNCSQSATYFTLKTLPQKQKELRAIIGDANKDDDDFMYQLKVANVLAQNGWYKEAFEHYLKAKEKLNP